MPPKITSHKPTPLDNPPGPYAPNPAGSSRSRGKQREEDIPGPSSRRSATAVLPRRDSSALVSKMTSASVPPTRTVDPAMPATPQQHEADKRTYGTDEATFRAFCGSPGVHYARSASAGLKLASLNDHDGVLLVTGRDGESTIAERFVVVKDTVDGEDRYFVKGHADRAIRFDEFTQTVARNKARPMAEQASHLENLQTELRHLLDAKPWENPLLETPLRSEILRLSLQSTLTFRRDDKESGNKLMPLPPNPTVFPKKVAWANSENAVGGGAGPVQPNGTRRFQLDWNRIENRLLGFVNLNGDLPRRDAVMADSVPGHKAPILVDGPVLFQIEGLLRPPEVLGPAAAHAGVKGGNVQRLVGAALGGVFGSAPLEPGLRMLVSTEDGALHNLELTDRGMRLSLAPSTAGWHPDEGAGALGANTSVGADVDVYSYQGRDIGKYGSATGLPEPALVVSTCDALPAGPLTRAPGTGTVFAKELGRLLTYQPNLGGRGRVGAPRAANAAVTALSKFVTTSITSAIDRATRDAGGTHIAGARILSATGAGRVDPGVLAGSVALIVIAQEVETTVFDMLRQSLPSNWSTPSSPVARFMTKLGLGSAEELLRLETNLSIQKLLGIRQGTSADHATVAISSATRGVVEAIRDRAGSRASHPYVHTALDAFANVQYMLLRSVGIAYGAAPGAKGRGTDVAEALATRSIVRAYDQILAPVFTQLLNTHGIVGPNVDPFGHQLARERHLSNLTGEFKSALQDAIHKNVWQPMEALVKDGDLLLTMRSRIDQALVGDYEVPEATGSGIGASAQAAAGAVDRTVGPRRSLQETEPFDPVLRRQERAKTLLNRVDLYGANASAASTLMSALYAAVRSSFSRSVAQAIDLEAGDPATRVGRAVEMQTLGRSDPGAREALLQKEKAAQRARIAGSEAYASGRTELAADQAVPTTNSLGEASTSMQRFVHQQYDVLRDRHQSLFTSEDGKLDPERSRTSTLRPVVPQPVTLDQSGRARPAAGKQVASALRREGVVIEQGRVRKAVGTFSRELQAGSLPAHGPMARASGMPAVTAGRAGTARGEALKPLDEAVKKRIDLFTRSYTKESQFFHYPLRWQVTGEAVLLEVAPGVHVPYNTMNRAGNVAGDKGERVDPIGSLYMNLGCARAEPFPSHLVRAVVTDGSYFDRPGQPEVPGTVHTGGSKVITTEIFSASAADKVVAEFGVPIAGYTAAPRSNSQRLDLVLNTAVNIAALSDLAQAEAIVMPGAVMTVHRVDPNAGKPVAAQGNTQDIGQVVYLEQLDTYALEQAFDRCLEALRGGSEAERPADGTLVTEPDSGQMFRFVDSPKAGEKLYDPIRKAFYSFDVRDASHRNGGLRFASETKNYFLARPLEFDTNPPTQRALWRHPFTAETAKRATKDAIHAAIVRNDPIVPFLDEAVKNLHHEYFRREGGFYDKEAVDGQMRFVNPRASEEAARREEIRTQAREIAGQHFDLAAKFRQKQTLEAAELMAALMVSYLRRPLKLVPVKDCEGMSPQGIELTETYDKVDLHKQPLSLKPEPSVVIGVGGDGYYALRNVDGRFEATHRLQGRVGGRTPENFVQAFLRAGPFGADRYDEVPSDLAGGELLSMPDDRAARAGRILLEKLSAFARTEYVELQSAMVQWAERAAGRPSLRSQSVVAPAAGRSAPHEPSIAEEDPLQFGSSVVEGRAAAQNFIDLVADEDERFARDQATPEASSRAGLAA